MSTQIGNGGKIDEEGYGRWLYTLFTPGAGVAIDVDALKVQQRAAGANMSVDINTGNGYIDRSSAYGYWVWVATSDENVLVDAADPSNPRVDRVVAYVNLSDISTSVTNNTGALEFEAVAGTPAGSPTAPNDATVQAAIGAGNPFIDLAQLAVAAADTSIVTADITDKRKPISLRSHIAPLITEITSTTVLSWGYNMVKCNATGGAITATLPDATLLSGGTQTLYKSDSSSNLVTIGTTSSQTMLHPGGGVPTQTGLPKQGDMITFRSDGTNWVVVDDKRHALLATASRTSAYTNTETASTTAGARITTLAPLTVTIPGGVKYEVLLYAVQCYNSTAGTTTSIHIYDGDNTSGGTIIAQSNHNQVTGVTGQGQVLVKSIIQAAVTTNTAKSFYPTLSAGGATTNTLNAGAAGAAAYVEVRIVK